MAEQDVAHRYFAAMRVQDLEALLALFDEAGIIVWPDGRTIEGRTATREIYGRPFRAPSNNPAPGKLMIGPDSFAVEVFSRLDSGEARRTINVFRLNERGLIARMDCYRQG